MTQPPTVDTSFLNELDIWRDEPTGVEPVDELHAEPTQVRPPAGVALGAIDLAPQQREAVEKIVAWYQDEDAPQVFRLFGYAGTGKTTLARGIVDQLGLTAVEYAAFTGKAAYVLRTKGCTGASTIHSLIYLPSEKLRAHLQDLRRQLEAETDRDARAKLEREIKLEEKRLESPNWILKGPEECLLTSTQLLVVDEVSMVNTQMGLDLLGYKQKTLVLGDPAQLPPVEGGGFFIEAQPDHLLTEIHRSALDSPVTRMATAVRNAPVGDRRYGVPGADGDSGRRQRLTLDELLGFDQVLVGTNRTRWQAVHLLRGLRGLVGQMPQPGDRIMALANSSDAEVFNGQQFTVTASTTHPDRDDQYRLTVVDDDGTTRPLTVWASGFADLEGEKKAKREGRGSVAAATFAQAITCHKSQGSQWDNVLVIDESGVFASIAQKEAMRVTPGNALEAGHRAGQQWLYTAITRAAKRAVIVPSINGILA